MSACEGEFIAGIIKTPYALTLPEWRCVVECLNGLAEMTASAAEGAAVPAVARNASAIIAQLAAMVEDHLPIDYEPAGTEE